MLVLARRLIERLVLVVVSLLLLGCASREYGEPAGVGDAAARAASSATRVTARDPPSGHPDLAEGLYRVLDVIDGDTLRVRAGDRDLVVRLLGIDTPELRRPGGSQCYGPEARSRLDGLVAGRDVLLTYDERSGRRDRYGRTLAYVRLAGGQGGAVAPDPGVGTVNERLVGEGYAREYDRGPPHRYEREFDAAQAGAQAARLGLWGAC